MRESENLNYWNVDLVIVGAGPAGLSATLAAIESDKRVLLIDQGQSWKNYYLPSDLTNIPKFVGGVGGTANAWGGQCGTFTAKDLKDWQVILDEFTLESWLNGIKMISKQLSLPLNDCNLYFGLDSRLKAHFSSVEEGEVLHTLYVKDIFIKNYFAKCLQSPRLTLLKEEVAKLHFDRNLNASSLEFTSGQKVNLGAAKLVVALGAVSTTKLIHKSLFLSYPLPCSILDHPQGYVFEITGKKPIYLNSIGYFKKGKTFYKRKFCITLDERECVFEIHQQAKKPTFRLTTFKSIFVTIRDSVCFLLDIVGLKFFRMSITQNVISRVWVQSDQKLSNLVTENDISRENPNWRISENDIEFILRASHIFAQWLESVGVIIHGKIDAIAVRDGLTHSFHPSSSLVRLEFDETYLVSRFGRISERSNTLIASSAIFPLTGWINPTLNIMGFSYAATKELLLST